MCAISLATACGDDTKVRTPRAEADAPADAVQSTAIAASERPSTQRDSLAARLEFPTGASRPQGLLVADLNDDGSDELIVAAASPGALQIWSGLSARFDAPPTPRSMAIDDFPLGPVWLKPGQTVAVASREKPGIAVYDVRRAFAAAPDVQSAPEWTLALDERPRVLASGAGPIDCVVLDSEDQLVLVREHKLAFKKKLEGTLPTCAYLDAHESTLSLYVGFQGTRSLSLYRAAGAAELAPLRTVTLAGLPRAFAWKREADHARSRLLVAGGDSSVWVFTPELELDGECKVGKIPVALDVSTRPYILCAAMRGQQIDLIDALVGDERRSIGYAGQHPLDARSGDFDGDGFADIAIANGAAKRLSLVFGAKDAAFFEATTLPVGRQPSALASGDLDGDGKLELCVVNALDGQLGVVSERAPHRVVSPLPGGNLLRMLDLDGDQNLDLVCVRQVGQQALLDVLFGDGKGQLAQRATLTPRAVGAKATDLDLVLVDLDQDGQLEALVADPTGGQVLLVPVTRGTEGALTLDEPRALEVQSGPCALALLDAHGDAQLEVAVGLAGPGAREGVAFLRAVRNAEGQLALEEYSFLQLKEGPSQLASTDFDGDGTTDIALLVKHGDGEGLVRVGLQNKDHSWRQLETFTTSLRPYAMRTGDVDGDGRPDLVISAQNSHHVNLWLTRPGDPLRFVRTADLGAGTGCLGLELADIDGDGRVEIVVANTFAGSLSVLRAR